MVDRASLAGHRSLQDWLQAVCEDHGSQVRLANAVGVSAQAVSKWMKGSRPGDQYLRRIADYFGVPYSELVQFFHPGITSGSRVELPPASTVAIRGVLRPAATGWFTMLDTEVVVGRVRGPAAGPNAVAYRVMGDALAPRVRAGEFVVVDPDAEPAAGDELVVVMRDGRVAVLQLLARTADMVSMQEITASPKPVTLAPDEIEHMHVVVAIAKPSQWVREV